MNKFVRGTKWVLIAPDRPYASAVKPRFSPLLVLFLLVLAAAIVFAVLPALRGRARVNPAGPRIAWETPPAELVGGATTRPADSRPMLLDFTASWCPPCQAMKQTIWPAAAVVEAAAAYRPVVVDIDRHPELAARFGVDSIPNVMVLSPDGTRVLAGFVGYRDVTPLLAFLRANASEPELDTD